MPDLLDSLTAAIAKRYRVLGPLGEGSAGLVVKALDVNLGRLVAIKVLKPDVRSSGSVEQFTNEIKTTAALQHPNVVVVYEAGEADGLLYYTMQFVEGGSLKDRLERQGRIPIAEALHIAQEVSAGLAAAHGAGFVHRDIKPSNILFQGERPLVADFGLATLMSSVTGLREMSRAGGTPLYMSPEQFSGDMELDARSDLYSLACVVVQMITGTVPFGDLGSVQAIRTARMVDTAPRISALGARVPIEVETALATALAKKREDRFGSVAEFARALAKVPSTEAVTQVVARAKKSRKKTPSRRSPAVVPTVVSGEVWHLADLALKPSAARRPKERASGGRKNKASDVAESSWLFDYIDQCRARPSSSDGPLVDAVIITGGIVADGMSSRLKDTKSFLGDLRRRLGIDGKRMFVVPNAADIDWRHGTGLQGARRRSFRSALGSCQSAKAAAELFRISDCGLALLLLDTASDDASPVEVEKLVAFIRKRHGGTADATRWIDTVRSHSGALTLSTLGEALHELGNPELQAGLSRMSATSSIPDILRLPPERLGILVTTTPLASMPIRGEAEQRRHPLLGAAEVKRLLQATGIHLCLHGSVSNAAVVSEWTYQGRARNEFAHIGTGGLSGADSGFNIVRYALHTGTGEALVVVQPVALEEGVPRETHQRTRLRVLARRGRPCRGIRLIDRMSEHGDSRTDWWYTALHTDGWAQAGQGHRSHLIRLIVESAGSRNEPAPELTLLSPPEPAVTCVFTPDAPLMDGSSAEVVKGRLSVRAEQAVRSVNLGYRIHTNHSYCNSLASRARSFSMPREIPEIEYDREGLVYPLREPTDRLEILLEFPFRAPTANDVDLRSYAEELQERLVPANHLLEFSKRTLDTLPKAKRVMAVIRRPLLGVAYGVTWKLPDHDPWLLEVPRTDLDDAIRESEALRVWALSANEDEAKRERLSREVFAPFEEYVSQLLRPSSGAPEDDPIELAFFLPSEPCVTITRWAELHTKNQDPGRQTLRVIWANFDRKETEIGMRLPVPHSIGGRAYAANCPAQYFSPDVRSRRGTRREEGVDPYLRLSGPDGRPLRSHHVMYAVPIRHWRVDSVVFGTVCLGSYLPGSRLDLGDYEFKSIISEAKLVCERLLTRYMEEERRRGP